MLDKIKDRNLWESFYEYKTKNEQNKVQEMRELRAFIADKRYAYWAEKIENGDEVEIDFDTGVITDKTTGQTFKAQPFPDFIKEIINAGGLLNSLNK